MKYRYALFDLDGTVIDSGEGITKSTQYALSRMGIEEPDLNRLRAFVGPPLLDSFRDLYGMSEEKAMEAVDWYRERYSSKGLYECHPYEGIGELLEALQQEGRKLAVASSKPERFVREILEHFGIGQYFSEIVGATMDEKLSSKPDIIREVFRRGRLTQADKASVIMIGDRRYDIEGANETGLDSIGVYYGFAEPGELEKAGATYIAETVQDLADLFRRI